MDRAAVRRHGDRLIRAGFPAAMPIRQAHIVVIKPMPLADNARAAIHVPDMLVDRRANPCLAITRPVPLNSIPADGQLNLFEIKPVAQDAEGHHVGPIGPGVLGHRLVVEVGPAQVLDAVGPPRPLLRGQFRAVSRAAHGLVDALSGNEERAVHRPVDRIQLIRRQHDVFGIEERPRPEVIGLHAADASRRRPQAKVAYPAVQPVVPEDDVLRIGHGLGDGGPVVAHRPSHAVGRVRAEELVRRAHVQHLVAPHGYIVGIDHHTARRLEAVTRSVGVPQHHDVVVRASVELANAEVGLFPLDTVRRNGAAQTAPPARSAVRTVRQLLPGQIVELHVADVGGEHEMDDPPTLPGAVGAQDLAGVGRGVHGQRYASAGGEEHLVQEQLLLRSDIMNRVCHGVSSR